MQYRLFNNPNSSIFDLIDYTEPSQTKALGYLLAKSPLAMKSFLELLYSQKRVSYLILLKWVVDCEYRRADKDVSSQRVDILIRFFDNYVPVLAILVEAKSIGVGTSALVAAQQANQYLQTFDSLQPFIGNIDLVTLTKFKSLVSSSSSVGSTVKNYFMLLWQDVQNIFLGVTLNKKHNSIERELIKDYLFYLSNIKNAMRFYDKEVLVLPANKTHQTIQNYLFYECAANTKHGDARANSHPLFVAFRVGGTVSELFRIREIIKVNMTDAAAIAYLTQTYRYLDGGLQQYVDNMIASFNSLHPDQQLAAVKPWDDRWFFVLEQKIITLPKPVVVKYCRNHTFYTLDQLI